MRELLLIKNIGCLVGITPGGVLRKQGTEMSETGTLENAWLLAEDGLVKGFGEMDSCPEFHVADDSGIRENTILPEGFLTEEDKLTVLDASGGMVLPSFCDSHTHIVFAGSREQEFLDKINGLSYAEIAAHGGGILNSADLLHETSEDELYRQAMSRVNEMVSYGTGAIEIKSGYGLTLEDELKILHVIRRIRRSSPAVIRATFLGAHAVGRAFSGRKSDYVDLVCNEMIPAIGEENRKSADDVPLADFVDVFCEDGFFTPGDTDRILGEAERYGLGIKLHANQLAVSGGVQAGVRHGALSVDHLESTTDDEINALRGTTTMPTMLPGASFFLRMQYGEARKFIDSGLGVALASDYNPGSSPCGDMRFIMALACIQMRLTPVQAFNACTLNSAYAMKISDLAGSISAGKIANLIITRPVPSLTWIPYCYRSPFIDRIILQGRIQTLS